MNNAEHTLWTSETSPAEFFHEKILVAQQKQNLKLTENVEFYLVNLLCHYVNNADHDSNADCLALTLKKALESPEHERIILYRKLADTALYFAGYFQEYFHNKTFDVGYYVNMGESAYGELASLMRGQSSYQKTMATIYQEMSKNFVYAVDVLLQVSEETNPQEHKLRSTLSVYEAWLHTASPKLQQELIRRGLHPIPARTGLI